MIQCPFCHENRLDVQTERLRFDLPGQVYRCQKCSLVFLDPESINLPPHFYEGDYHQTYLTHVEPAAFNPQVYFEKMLAVSKPWSDKIRKLLKGDEVVLDFGCSTGHVAYQLKDYVKEIYGHELNKKEIEFARQTLHLDVDDKPLRSRFSDSTFDVIIMVFVLEHIAKPVSLLKELRQLLKPHGKIIIVVPSLSEALVSLYDIPEYRNFYYCAEHLYYYSEKTLHLLLQLADLYGDVEITQEYPLLNHFKWFFCKKPSDVLGARLDVPPITTTNNEILEDWNKLWNKIENDYKGFLKSHHYGDRLFCTAGKVAND